jgi:hypothetical protein
MKTIKLRVSKNDAKCLYAALGMSRELMIGWIEGSTRRKEVAKLSRDVDSLARLLKVIRLEKRRMGRKKGGVESCK